jgi:butyrate kinase
VEDLYIPVESGVYEVNEQIKHDLIHSPVGEDIINIGGLLAAAIAAEIPGARAMIADPTVVDELEEIARITGAPGIKRKSIFHALNQKASRESSRRDPQTKVRGFEPYYSSHGQWYYSWSSS